MQTKEKIFSRNIEALVKDLKRYDSDYIISEEEFINDILEKFEITTDEAILDIFNPKDVERIKELYFFEEDEKDLVKLVIKHHLIFFAKFSQKTKYHLPAKQVRINLRTEQVILDYRHNKYFKGA